MREWLSILATTVAASYDAPVETAVEAVVSAANRLPPRVADCGPDEGSLHEAVELSGRRRPLLLDG
jgi:hypothetical protein